MNRTSVNPKNTLAQENTLRFSLKNKTEIIIENHPNVWLPFSPSCVAMCELISADCCAEKTVMDFAAGSGILGIVAAKHGASQVVCTDLNPDFVEASEKNWMLNHLDSNALQSLQSSCFEAMKGNPDFEGKFDRIYLNPPALPDTQEKLTLRLDPGKVATAGEWNRNGQRGRLVMDSLIVEGSTYLKVGGEMIFIATSKNGPRLTANLMEKHWGQGIKHNSDDPLNYTVNWQEHRDANWAVVHRLDIPLKDYHQDFVPAYERLAQQEGEPPPFVDKEGKLYQKLYFIRARKR